MVNCQFICKPFVERDHFVPVYTASGTVEPCSTTDTLKLGAGREIGRGSETTAPTRSLFTSIKTFAGKPQPWKNRAL